jgi:hypothetical protein
MQKALFLILFLCGMVLACSEYFTTDFCKEINWWNSRAIKYKYFEIEPNWLVFIDGIYSFNFVIRF